MCLIITGKAQTLRETLLDTPRLLEDVFKSNPDGIGVMYPSRRGLRIHKKLPKNAEQARHFLTRLPGDERNLAIHFRWQTHGWINKENCHPYVVVDGECALMHNGILRQGNDKDRSKSDTWHFIKDYLENIVAMAPQLVHDTGFKAMLRDFIGMTNRFVVMTKDGTVSVINAKEGVEHNGLWFSNTYAWTPSILIKGHTGGRGYTSSGYQGYQGGSYQSGGQSFRGGRYGGRHGYGGAFVGGEAAFGDPYDDYYQGNATAPAGSPAQSGSSGSHHSSGGAITVHNGGVTAATRFNHRAAEDDAEAEAWKKVRENSQRPWPNVPAANGASHSPAASPAASGGSAGAGAHAKADSDAPEEGEEAKAAAGASSAREDSQVGMPTNENLAEALLNADVDTFTVWLEKFPTTTFHMLFMLFTPEPTKWCHQSELDGYSRFVYDAMLNEDKQLLIAECERNDGSVAGVAEVICFYLNWLLGRDKAPKKNNQQQRQETKVGDKVVANTAEPMEAHPHEGGSVRFRFPQGPKPSNIVVDGVAFKGEATPQHSPAPAESSSIDNSNDADHHVDVPHEVQGAVSEAQLSQGGERDDGDDSYAYTSLYLG